MTKASNKTRVGWTSPVVNTSRCFYIDTGDLVSQYIRLISLSETDAQITNNGHSAFATWFGHSRAPTPAADAIESSSHPALVPGFCCGLAGASPLLRKAASRQ
jgi:hypothetical protein